jgi:hypothetical protein
MRDETLSRISRAAARRGETAVETAVRISAERVRTTLVLVRIGLSIGAVAWAIRRPVVPAERRAAPIGPASLLLTPMEALRTGRATTAQTTRNAAMVFAAPWRIGGNVLAHAVASRLPTKVRPCRTGSRVRAGGRSIGSGSTTTDSFRDARRRQAFEQKRCVLRVGVNGVEQVISAHEARAAIVEVGLGSSGVTLG